VILALGAFVAPAALRLVLELTGLRMIPALSFAAAAIALAIGLGCRQAVDPATRTPRLWVGLGALIAGSQAAVVALQPVTSWDFRYIWGLKARVLALAQGIDTQWLSWPPYARQHPDYPTLWPDLLAIGGGSAPAVTAAAAVWQAAVVVALAAACWDNLRDAPPPLRLAGAAIGAYAPVILSPGYWGNADLILAFFAAVALGSLARLGRSHQRDPAAVASLAVAVAGLCLTKNEGMVLALGVTVAAVLISRGIDRLAVAGAFLAAAGSWQAFLRLHGIAPEPRAMDVGAWLTSGRVVTSWFLAQSWEPVGLIILAWCLAFVALARRPSRGVVVALAIWVLGVAAAYVTSLQGTAWHLATSFDRVACTPLPGVVSVALASALAGMRDGSPQAFGTTPAASGEPDPPRYA
jgi:hypothetical protein